MPVIQDGPLIQIPRCYVSVTIEVKKADGSAFDGQFSQLYEILGFMRNNRSEWEGVIFDEGKLRFVSELKGGKSYVHTPTELAQNDMRTSKALRK